MFENYCLIIFYSSASPFISSNSINISSTQAPHTVPASVTSCTSLTFLSFCFLIASSISPFVISRQVHKISFRSMVYLIKIVDNSERNVTPGIIAISGGYFQDFLIKEQFHIFINCANRGNAKVVNQYFRYIWR